MAATVSLKDGARREVQKIALKIPSQTSNPVMKTMPMVQPRILSMMRSFRDPEQNA
jgi:hypothetical protein